MHHSRQIKPYKKNTMCQHCNYSKLLRLRGLDPTPHRLRIMEVIGNNSSPIGAQEIFSHGEENREYQPGHRVSHPGTAGGKRTGGATERKGQKPALRHGAVRASPRSPPFPLQELRRHTLPAALQPQRRYQEYPVFISPVKSGKWKFGYTGSARTVFIRNKFQCNTL